MPESGREIDVDNLAYLAIEKIAVFSASVVCDVCLSIVLEISTQLEGSTPAIGLSEKAIQTLHKIGASVDVDTYLSFPEWYVL